MAITIEEHDRKITVAIEGEEYALLERAARALNSCSWTKNDNTPLSVFENFTWAWLEDIFTERGKLAEDILGGCATDPATFTDAPEPLHSQRLTELREAFKAAGLWAK